MRTRVVQPETLDYLDENDLHAIRSRKDLRRINIVMGTRAIMLKALHRTGMQPKRIIEIGAGDGTLMLALARRLSPHWSGAHVTLLDRQKLVAPSTIEAFRKLGWQVEVLNTDILQWTALPASASYDVAVANLFLHHFEKEALSAILNALAARSNAFCICEPRRSKLALWGSHLVGLLGANQVTREDAVLSVRAGFKGKELSDLLLPVAGAGAWHIEEYAAGLFSHCLVAARLPSEGLTHAA